MKGVKGMDECRNNATLIEGEGCDCGFAVEQWIFTLEDDTEVTKKVVVEP